MNAYFALSARRGFPALAGLLAALALTLALAPLSGRAAGVPARQAVDAVLLFWAVLGLPGSALLLGASGGAQTAASAEADAPLPLSAEKRAFWSLGASALSLAILAAAVGAVAAVAHAEVPALRLFPQMDDLVGPYLSVVAAVCACAVPFAFGCAYGAGSGPAGGLAAGLGAVVLNAVLAFMLVFGLFRVADGDASLYSYGLTVCVLVVLAAALALVLGAARQARLRRPTRRAAAALGGVAIACAACPLALGRAWYEIEARHLSPLHHFVGSIRRTAPGAFDRERRRPDGGVLLGDMRGRLAWEHDGRRDELVAPLEASTRGFWAGHYYGTGDAYLLDGGTICLVREIDDGRELWCGRPGSPFARRSTIDRRVMFEGVDDSATGPEATAYEEGRWLRAPLVGTGELKWTVDAQRMAARRSRRAGVRGASRPSARP